MSNRQTDLPGLLHDPANYREMSRPFASAEEAEAALAAFWDGLYELRNKCRLGDVLTVVGVNAITTDGEGRMIAILHAGDQSNAEGLAAYAFGQEQARRQERISELLTKATVVRTGSRRGTRLEGAKS